MSRQDPGAATGGIPTEPGYCECNEIESVHVVRADGSRGGCSRSDCGCPRYMPVPVCCRCDRKLCAADDTGEHCTDRGCAWCLNGCPATETPCCREA